MFVFILCIVCAFALEVLSETLVFVMVYLLLLCMCCARYLIVQAVIVRPNNDSRSMAKSYNQIHHNQEY